MKVIVPLTVTSSMVTSSTAAETVSAYAAGTTYAVNDQVRYGTRIYQSSQGSNTGHTPDTSLTWWVDMGPTNTFAMFDTQVSTQTLGTTTLTTVVTPNSFYNSMAIIGLDATNVSVTITDGAGGPTIYSYTAGTDNTIISDWYMYFFEPYNKSTEIVLYNIPVYKTSVVTLTFSDDDLVKVGGVIFGNIYEIGSTQRGVSVGILDYSVKNTDQFGTTTFIKRGFSRRMTSNVFLANNRLNIIYKLFQDLRATPALWIASEDSDYQTSIVYGFYKEFNVEISYPEYCMYSLEIEGLT